MAMNARVVRWFRSSHTVLGVVGPTLCCARLIRALMAFGAKQLDIVRLLASQGMIMQVVYVFGEQLGCRGTRRDPPRGSNHVVSIVLASHPREQQPPLQQLRQLGCENVPSPITAFAYFTT
jgi:hypothetical protein